MISIVVPAYNEEAGIERTVREIQDALVGCGIEHEIIVVDDGSRDGTYRKVQEMTQNNKTIRGIRFSRNFGKESAILAGLQAMRGEAAITIDADLQHPPQLIPEMVGRWRNGARVVHAVKRNREGDGLAVRCRAALFNRLFTMVGGIDMNNASDFKLLDRVAVDVVVSQLKEKRRFYRGLVQWVGFEQETLSFDVEARRSGTGKWSFRDLVSLGITAIISFTSTPLRIVTVLGIVTLCFALLVASETLWSVYKGKSVSGFATLEITILLIGSFIMISLGIVGEYIAKIYDETKARPSYIVGSRCGFEEENEPR